MNEAAKTGIGIVTAIIALAILSVVVSKKSTTVPVIQSFASALGNLLGVVVAPINTGTAQASSQGASTQAPPAAPQGTPSAAQGGSGLLGALQGLQSLAGTLPHVLSGVNSLGNSLSSMAGTTGATANGP